MVAYFNVSREDGRSVPLLAESVPKVSLVVVLGFRDGGLQFPSASNVL